MSAVVTPLEHRLRRELSGEVLFDTFSRGRYSTDASHYQIEPLGVVVPRDWNDVRCTLQIAAEANVPVLARGGGTSQCGQTVAPALVIDTSKHLRRLVDLDTGAQRATVEPGMVLDHLNAELAPHGLWFPVDVSTASRATLGGMAGNNSCGARSIRYGTMRDNVVGIDAALMDGTEAAFGLLGANTGHLPDGLLQPLLELGEREAAEIAARFPDLMRRVGGYNIDALVAGNDEPVNLSHLLVGSEGTLAVSRQLHLKLSPLPQHKVLGVCHFPTFYAAMDSAQHIVELDPTAVELVDRTMLELSRDIQMFRDTITRCVRGEPAALLLVEFAGDDEAANLRGLASLVELMSDLGFPGAVVELVDPAEQRALWEVRKAGLNIMMSMKGDGKPVSFIEDCAVRLEDLAEYTRRLTEVFDKHGTTGTWYAHASVGCLHVRPVLNLKLDNEAKKMRAIAEEAFEMVREYKGSHSGEHGDGLVRSEFHEAMFGKRMNSNFEQVKDTFDPAGLLNPGKIVRPERMDDRALFRFKPGYQCDLPETAFDWSRWHGLDGAVEMCNNNGACRKFDANVMCPSYRVTRDEKHVTRGRANALRLALSGQLGDDAFTSEQMRDAMALCVSCKGCKRECPTGVDMAKLKTEFLYHYRQRHGSSLHDRLVAFLPRYAPYVSRVRWLANARNSSRALKVLGERWLEFSARRSLPRWVKPFTADGSIGADGPKGDVVLLVDTFNHYFEPSNAHAAIAVLTAAGYRVQLPQVSRRPLCCGRTFLAAGLVDEARQEARRTLETLSPYLARGLPIIGLEPSCLFTFRDEIPDLLKGEDVRRLAESAVLFDEFLAAEENANGLEQLLAPLPIDSLLLHGHCHQKAFATLGASEKLLSMIPQANVSTISSSCCGMAGAFGYHRNTDEVSRQMAELSLLPAVRNAGQGAWIVASGTSCRHQIVDGTSREPLHIARVLERSLQARTGH